MISALVASLIPVDVEEYSVPHSSLPALEDKFRAIGRSYRHHQEGEEEGQWERQEEEEEEEDDGPVSIALVSCGGGKSRLEEVSVFLRAAVVAARRPINFVVFTDSLGEEVSALLARLNATGRFTTITLDLQQPVYPELEVQELPMEII